MIQWNLRFETECYNVDIVSSQGHNLLFDCERHLKKPSRDRRGYSFRRFLFLHDFHCHNRQRIEEDQEFKLR